MLQVSIEQYIDPSKDLGIGSADAPSALGIYPTPGELNFGVELEIGFDNEGRAASNIYKNVGGLCVVKHDCGALEIASAPLGFEDMKEYLDRFLGTPIPGMQSESTNWGMHVHVSASKCKGFHLANLVKFLHDQEPSKKEFLTYIARRCTDMYCSGDPMPGEGQYHRSWAHLPKLRDFLFANDPDEEDTWEEESERYGFAMNTHHDTHEFRLFKTTSDPCVAKANLEFVKSLVEYTADCNSLKVRDFGEYVMDHESHYPSLAVRIESYLLENTLPAAA